MRRHCLAVLVVLGLLLITPEVAYADNCGSLTDCFRSLQAALAALVGVGIFGILISIGLDFIPGVGTVKGIIEAITGRDLITGEELAMWERLLGIVPVVGALGTVGRNLDVFGDVLRAGEGVGEVADTAADITRYVEKYGDDAQQIVDKYGDVIGADILSAYDEIADIPGADNLLKDILAGGSTAQGALAEVGYAASLQKQGVEIAAVGDIIDGKKAGDIILGDGTVIDVKDFNWRSGYYSNPDNVQNVIDSLTNQVQLHQQRYPGQPIEYAFTDLANTPQEVVEALENLGVNVTQVTWPGRG